MPDSRVNLNSEIILKAAMTFTPEIDKANVYVTGSYRDYDASKASWPIQGDTLKK